jgi:hypothetical protein
MEQQSGALPAKSFAFADAADRSAGGPVTGITTGDDMPGILAKPPWLHSSPLFRVNSHTFALPCVTFRRNSGVPGYG